MLKRRILLFPHNQVQSHKSGDFPLFRFFLEFYGDRNMNKKFVAIVLFLIVSAAATFNVAAMANAIVIASKTVHSTGAMSGLNVGVYSDAACTVNCTHVDWGVLSPGDSVNRTVYVKNTGNSAETLGLALSNWVPSAASSYLCVAWNLQGLSLSAGQSVAASLCLTASPDIVGITDFSIDLAISGTS